MTSCYADTRKVVVARGVCENAPENFAPAFKDKLLPAISHMPDATSRVPIARWNWLGQFAVVLGIIAILVFLLLPVVRQARMNGPSGKMIPAEPPVEANRASNSTGWSIVLPKDWVCHADEERLTIATNTYKRRGSALLIVSPVAGESSAEPPDLAARREQLGFTPTTFQGSPAYEKMSVERKGSFDDPAWSLYILECQVGTRRLVVKYGVALECKTLPPMVRRYIETIRWDPPVPADDGL